MRILSVARSVPERVLTNDDIVAEALERNADRLSGGDLVRLRSKLTRLLTAMGADTRRRCSGGENAIDHGTAAAHSALQAAGMHPRDVDLLIYAGVSRGMIEPATVNVFLDSAGLTNATGFDVLDACAGWVRGLDLADSLMTTRHYRNAMIVACEFHASHHPRLTSIAQFRERCAAYTIGEAATATIVSGEDGEFRSVFSNSGSGNVLCQIPLVGEGPFATAPDAAEKLPMQFYADLSALHSSVIRELSTLYSEHEFAQAEHDIVFGHAAGVPVTRKVAKALDIDLERHYEIFPEFGNTVSASIPLAMSLAQDDGALKRGTRALVVVGSAGISAAIASLVF